MRTDVAGGVEFREVLSRERCKSIWVWCVQMQVWWNNKRQGSRWRQGRLTRPVVRGANNGQPDVCQGRDAGARMEPGYPAVC